MTKEEVMALAVRTARRRMKNASLKYPVKITKVDTKNKTYVALTMREEPKNCSFKNEEYWLPAYDSLHKRLYLIYGDSKNGYKMSKSGPNQIGRIQWQDAKLLEDLNALSPEKFSLFNWQWDTECGYPYVDIG